jgi:hypothetical protein
MFEKFNKYRSILVTGPQRSGTTIATKMIAQDTGKKHIGESVIYEQNKNNFMHNFRLKIDYWAKQESVIHCPTLVSVCNDYDISDILIVFMMRDIEDIIASQKRVGWGSEHFEKEFFPPDKRPISVIKQEFWKNNKPSNGMEIHYEDLKGHPLWIPKHKRISFHSKQTILATKDFYHKML